jgi:hypothetical protein
MPTPPDFTNGTPLDASSLNDIGLWEVGTMTFSNSTSQTIDGVFTTNYRRYLLVWDFTSGDAAADNLFLQFRKNGANAASGYNNTWIYTLRTSASPLTAYAASEPQMTVGYVGTFLGGGFMYISRPAISGPTGVVWTGGGNGSTQGLFSTGQGSHTTADVYDGLRLLKTNGVGLTGQVKIYGMRD